MNRLRALPRAEALLQEELNRVLGQSQGVPELVVAYWVNWWEELPSSTVNRILVLAIGAGLLPQIEWPAYLEPSLLKGTKHWNCDIRQLDGTALWRKLKNLQRVDRLWNLNPSMDFRLTMGLEVAQVVLRPVNDKYGKQWRPPLLREHSSAFNLDRIRHEASLLSPRERQQLSLPKLCAMYRKHFPASWCTTDHPSETWQAFLARQLLVHRAASATPLASSWSLTTLETLQLIVACSDSLKTFGSIRLNPGRDVYEDDDQIEITPSMFRCTHATLAQTALRASRRLSSLLVPGS